jgi:ParB family chromosome partitioning protein
MSKRKDAMGKGIRALLSGIDEETEVLRINETDQDSIINTVPRLSLDFIEVNPFQPRADFNEEALKDLAHSISIHGVIQPITVRKIGDKKFQLIAGERRLRASKMAGKIDIPAYIRVANDQESLEIALIENIQREDLNSMEIAINYKRLIDECELTHESLGDRLGKDRSTVTNYLRLLKLPPEIQQSLKSRLISMGHARAIIGIAEIDKQLFVYKEIETKGLSVRKTEELVRLMNTGSIRPKEGVKPEAVVLPVAYKNVENKLTDIFDTKVRIRKSKDDKGDIIIPFYSLADINRLLAIIEKE